MTLTWEDLRCPNCEALIAELITAPYRIRCRRCGAIVQCLVLADTQVVTERLKGRWADGHDDTYTNKRS